MNYYTSTSNPTTLPDLFINPNAQSLSGISTQTLPLKPLEKQTFPVGNQSVYQYNEYNPNTVITYNTYGQSNPNIENPLLYQSKHADNSAVFMGKGYPGSAINANNQKNNNRILLDTDSILSSQYLDNFSPNGCLNNNQCVY